MDWLYIYVYLHQAEDNLIDFYVLCLFLFLFFIVNLKL